MAQVRVRERNQITLPTAIARAANVSANDLLDVEFVNGVITLAAPPQINKRRSILDFVGIAPGMWGKNKDEIADSIRDERESWER